ncbi:MAG: hypothetical protein PHG69_02895 [Candidatus Omnitrophica bacterium]|nr:hypothetical protein [Candidatus Omnitrophota bacterium]
MKKKTLLFCSLSALIFCANVFAETIYLNSGNKVTGTIVTQTEDRVVIRIGEGEYTSEVTFFSDEIKSIEKPEESTPPAKEAIVFDMKKTEEAPLETPPPTASLEPVVSEQPTVSAQPIEPLQPATSAQPAVIQGQTIITKQKLEKIPTPIEEAKEIVKVKADIEAVVDNSAAQLPQQLENEIGAVKEEINAETQQRLMFEQLSLLLNKEELDYFTNINSIAKDTINKTTQIFTESESASQETPEALAKSSEDMKNLSSELSGIITQLGAAQPPASFKEFHKYYLEDINLLKDILMDMSNNNNVANQEKTAKLQELDAKIQEELNRVLQERQSKVKAENIDASN